MTEKEKVIAAYICHNEKLPDKRCEKCPYGYEYLDQTGDSYFVGCNTERIMVDAIDLLKVREPVKPVYELGITRCGQCNHEIDKYGGDNYCPKCGKAVKWE